MTSFVVSAHKKGSCYRMPVSITKKDKPPAKWMDFTAYIPIKLEETVDYAGFSVPDPVLNKLNELAALPQGWEYGKGRGTLPAVYQAACALYRDLAPYHLEADAFPCADGSVYVVFYMGLLSVEVAFWADGTIDVTEEVGHGEEIRELESHEDVSPTDARNLVIRMLVQESPSWQLSESFIPGTMIGGAAISEVRVLPHQAMVPEYQLSIPPASLRRVSQCVSISPDTMGVLPTEDPLFIGGCRSINSPRRSSVAFPQATQEIYVIECS